MPSITLTTIPQLLQIGNTNTLLICSWKPTPPAPPGDQNVPYSWPLRWKDIDNKHPKYTAETEFN